MNAVTPWQNDAQASILSLDGEWSFALADQTGVICTPGVWEAQGYERRVDGPAVFRRSIFIPSGWQGQRVQLQFDALSYYVEARVNGLPVGDHTGMWTAFAFDVTDAIRPAETNLIELTVFKPGGRFPLRESLAGFLPDVCIPFGGIWQPARLVAFPGAAVGEVWLLPEPETGDVRVEASVHAADGMAAEVRVCDPSGAECVSWRGVVQSGRLQTVVRVEQPRRWSPQTPALYTAEIRLEAGGEVALRVQRTFGFRRLASEGERLYFNDETVFLRGVLNWGWYPDRLCPAPDEAAIREEFRRVRELGFNLIKLCLYVPSPLYFEIADQEGMFLWLELPLWLPQVTDRLARQAPIEYRDMALRVHHHPSIIIYSLGCELDSAVGADLLGQLDAIVRSRTSGVLMCDNSGSGEAYGGLTFDYADFNDYHFYCDLHYFTPLVDHFSRSWRSPRPWIFGEFCDADEYRDLDEIRAAFGGALPWWLTEKNPIHPLEVLAYPQQIERMARLTDLGFSGQDLQRISRQGSFIIRKTILEKVRGRGGMGGYVVTGIRDTPLATSAVFDDLGRSKYDPDAFRTFNADTVLVLEQGRRRIWRRGGDRPNPVDRFNLTANTPVEYHLVLAHASEALPGGEVRWRLLDAQGHTLTTGQAQAAGPLMGGAPREIAVINFQAPERGGEYLLEAALGEVRNQWTLWVYPAPSAVPEKLAWYDPSGSLDGLEPLRERALDLSRRGHFDAFGDHLLVTSAATEGVWEFIRGGGQALILQAGIGALPVIPCPFWREAIKLIVEHPAWADFPHRGFADLQFYHLATDIALDTTQLRDMLPDLQRLKPILRRLDARRFMLTDYLLEAHLGKGRAIFSTLRFAGGMGDQVSGLEANVAARHLLFSILNYLGTGK